MASAPSAVVLRQIHNLVAAEQAERLSDRELLDRFTARREEEAFAALLRRHGPLVLGVCRRVLGDRHEAEDAFQATFLILAAKSGSIRNRDSLASWLYQVAYRAAVKARWDAARRRQEPPPPERRCEDPLAELSARELLSALDEELHGLPDRFRAPLVLCHLEGRTCDEAARELGWAVRTLKRRLEQGRGRLRRRLDGRGLSLPAALLAAGAAATSAHAVPPGLLRSTLTAATQPAATMAPALGGAVLGALTTARVKLLSVAAVVAGVVALGSVLSQATAERAAAAQGIAPGQPLPAQKGKPDPVAKKEVAVAGQVFDAKGKPVAGADVVLLGVPRRPGKAAEHQALARGKTDAQGRYSLKHAGEEAVQFIPLHVIATAKGHGLGWWRVDRPARGREPNIYLPPAVPTAVRFIDLQGIAAANIKAEVVHVENRSLDWLAKDLWPKARTPLEEQMMRAEMRFREFHDSRRDGLGLTFEPALAGEAAGWPRPLTADKDGRVTLPGFGKGQVIHVRIEDDRFARQEVEVDLTGQDAKEVRVSLAPAQYLEGRVTLADTGKPAAGVTVNVSSQRTAVGGFRRPSGRPITLKTDAEGRYKTNLHISDTVEAVCFAAQGTPYLHRVERRDWPRGAVQQTMDIALPRGVLLQGKLTDKTSGAPVAKAKVVFEPRRGEATLPRGLAPPLYYPGYTADDGSYKLAVPASPGHLLVEAPGKDWVTRTITQAELLTGTVGGQSLYFHRIEPLSLKPQDGPKEHDLTVTRGVTLRGQVVGADGKPAKGTVLLHAGDLAGPRGMGILPPTPIITTSPMTAVRDGKFELPGCDPERTYRLVAFQSQAKAPQGDVGAILVPGVVGAGTRLNLAANAKGEYLAAAAEVTPGKAGKDGLTLKLAPCATAELRLVGADGKAMKDEQLGGPSGEPGVVVLPRRLAPHLWLQLQVAQARGNVPAEWAAFSVSGKTDGDGKLVIPGLVPGATYRLRGAPASDPTQIVIDREFTAPAAGQTARLGDAKLGK